MAALAGVAAAAVVLSVAELIGAFFTARATPVIALGSTFIDFTPPWLKDFAIATFGTNDKAALFVGMGLTIFLLACVLGVVAYRKWALGVAGVLLMGAVIVASVVTRAERQAGGCHPTLLGTVAGLVVLRLLVSTGVAAAVLARGCRLTSGQRSPTGRQPAGGAFFAATGITAAAAGIAATGGRLLSAARSNVAQARGSLQAARAGQGSRRRSRRCAVRGARRHAVADAQRRLLPDRYGPQRSRNQRRGLGTARPRPGGAGGPADASRTCSTPS